MRKIVSKVSSFIAVALFVVLAMTGCAFEQTPYTRPRIDTPKVAVSTDGVAVWDEPEGANYYVYVIDDGAQTTTDERRVVLEDGQTIKVKAISGKEGYDDSDFSEPKTYNAGITADPNHGHTDVNEDNSCDLCGESVLAELSFYAVNDLHGKFMDADGQPGVDEFTAYMKNLYADSKREEILLSSGDMWQGTVESSSNKGQLMTEWMNDLGFVSMTLGNHEYDWGANVLTPNSELANFPFLAINVTYNGNAVDYCQASTVVERGGVKVGIIGAIGDCLSSISGDFSGGLSFATNGLLTALVKAEANRLRSEEECDFIVYSIHDGGDEFSSSGINSVKNSDMPYYDSSLSNGYVDLVFEAHTHQQYILKDEYGVYHMQGGGENKAVSCAEVSFNTVTKNYTVSPRMISSGVYGSSSIDDDPIVDELFDKYFPDENPYTDVLGRNATSRNSTVICDKVARLYYDKGVETWGNKGYDIVLGGGFLSLRSPYKLQAGNLTYANMFAILPFDNEIVLGEISGYDLVNKFINSKNSSYHVYSTISAAAVDYNKKYYIVVDSYTSTYSRNNIKEVERLNGLYARDLLAEFVSGGGWAK